MTLKQVKVKWLLFIVIALFVAGCSNNQASSGNKSTSAAQKDGGTLNIAFQSEPTTLDPQITGNSSVKDAARNIYEGLVIFDSKGNVEPDLAEKIDISEDKKVYTFQLR
ncbi:ABC transporter substrate-binding protein, partial [Priestia megaterium]